VRVSELMTSARLVELASSLFDAGMYAQASLYAAMATSAKRSGKAVWDSVASGNESILSERQIAALQAAQQSGRRRAVICIY